MPDNQTLILCPFKAEAKLLAAIIQGCRSVGTNTWQFACGSILTWNSAGKAPMLKFLSTLTGLSDYKKIILFGAAGALDPALDVGQIFVCTPVQYKQQKLRINAMSGLPVAAQITVDEPILSKEKRESLFFETGAAIVDMESFFFIQALLPQNNNIAAIRFVSDTAQIPFAVPFSADIKQRFESSRKSLLTFLKA
ncbi:MAG: hypothetical protein EOM80_11905 [Erysipelotrichia bacterium]|nr:hypothetical protein [Erysipelotrichia bacterium]